MKEQQRPVERQQLLKKQISKKKEGGGMHIPLASSPENSLYQIAKVLGLVEPW
jgi:hypothetical protein